MVATPPPKVGTPSVGHPGVSAATNRYAIGTAIRKNFDGIYYGGKITEDNGKWYSIRYNDGDAEQVTHREATNILAFRASTAGYGAALS